VIFQPELILSVGPNSIYLRGLSFVGTYLPFKVSVIFQLCHDPVRWYCVLRCS